MLSHYSAQNLELLVSKIAKHGFCVMDNFISQATTLALFNEVTMLNDTAQMHAAGTGQALATINKGVRGDSIYWLHESDASSAQQVYFMQMEALRLSLNQHLYLGLFALESHLALYPIGAGYKKHLDKFKASNNNQQPQRQISCILYLNHHWLDENGGHLRLYLNQENETLDNPPLDILPVGGKLVVFLSDTFYHEVLPANKDRMSLTGWFLTR